MDRKSTKMVVRDISQSLGKLPPQALDVEEAVLGALLMDKNAIVDVASILKPEHFYSEQHQEIFKAVISLFSRGEKIDMRTVIFELRSLGKIELVGGAYKIAELTGRVSSSANVESHARILVELGIKREVIQLASHMHQEAYEDVSDPFMLVEQANLGLQNILDAAISTRAERSMKDIAYATLKEAEARQSGKHTGLDSGYPVLDQLLNGFQKTDLIIIGARPGMGKGLALSEDLLTPDGWIKMKDVRVGNMLIGSDGKPYPVTGVYPQGIKQTFRVMFDDGTSVVCDDTHLWYTQTRADRKIKGMRKGTVKTILEIKDTLKNGVRKNHSIPFIKPFELQEQATKIDPYLLGILIGDGCTRTNPVSISNPEPDIIEKIKTFLPEGYSLTVGSDGLNHRIRTNGNDKFLKFIPELSGKYSYDKEIPSEYLSNSIHNRIKLMQGLMDTDGNVTDKKSPWVEYTTTSPRLTMQVADLVRGLGGRCSYKMYKGKYSKNGEITETRYYYRLLIAFSNGIVPVSSKKHLAKYIPKRYSQKFITDVVDNGFEETQCISVGSPDNLFVTTGTTLTHNTAFIMQSAKEIAKRKIPVGIFSLEMSANQLVERLAVGESEIDSDVVKKGKMQPYEFQRYIAALGDISGLPLYIDDTPFMTIVELRARCMRMKTKYGVQMIIVDYLQLIKGVNEFGNKMNRDQEIGVISRTLKGIAKELEIPVVALAQLSRGVETRGGLKKPGLSDLRESGSIEQDADVVMFLYRPEYYKIMQDEDGYPTHGLCEVLVEKHRNGSTGKVNVKFVGKFTKFMPWIGSDSSPNFNPHTERQKHAEVHYKNPTEELPKEGEQDDLPF